MLATMGLIMRRERSDHCRKVILQVILQVMSPGMQMNMDSGMQMGMGSPDMQMGMMIPGKQSSEAASPIALTPSVSLIVYPVWLMIMLVATHSCIR